MTEAERNAAIDVIAEALDRLVTQAIFEDLRWAQQEGGRRFRVYSRDDMEKWPESEAEQEIEELLERPVSAACRWAIRRLGQHLYELTGSSEVMQEVPERVANRDPKSWGYRIDILAKRWDGIGEWWS